MNRNPHFSGGGRVCPPKPPWLNETTVRYNNDERGVLKRSVLLSTVSFPALNLSRQIHAEHARPASRDREISLMNKLSDLSHVAAPRCLPRSSNRPREGLQVLDNQSQFRGVSVMWLLPPIFRLTFSLSLSLFLSFSFTFSSTLPVRCLYASRVIGGRLGNYVFLAIVAA